MVSAYVYRRYFADYVAKCMKEREIHPWYVAYYSEMCDTTFRSCLKAAKLPKITSLIMIAELFECTVNELLGYEYVAVESRDRLFDSGLDTRHLSEYFNSQIERKMEELNMTTLDLASACECSEHIVNNRLKYRTLPDTAAMLQICDALDCTPSELLDY